MKKIIVLVAAFLVAGVTGCKKDFLSQEVNPNAPSVATPALLLSAALNNSARIVVNDYVGFGVWAGYWTTSGNYVPNQTLNEYQITNTSLNTSWGDWYANLTNYNNIQASAAKDPSQANFQAIAMIMKAYGFQMLVDEFGDVPYSQAFQPSTIIFPAYDKAQDIYEDLGKQLDAAIALIQKSGAAAASPGSSDIVFAGNMGNWAKFANSLKLRLAVRVSGPLDANTSDALVAGLAATASVGYLDASSEAYANPGYINAAGKQNPYYGGFGFDQNGNPGGNGVYYRANAFEVDQMEAFNDPRLTQIFNLVSPPPGSPANTPNGVRGNIFGDVSSNLLTNSYTSTTAGPGLVVSPSQGQPLFLGSESLFLQAEAVNSGFLPAATVGLSDVAGAQALYQDAITASFKELGATGADAYYTNGKNNVDWTASPNKEQAIITQKWIALTGNFPFEGWNEYRRTGYPAVPASIDPSKVNATTPYRVLYPNTELSTNTANLGKEGTIDPFNTKIFWMK
ncbi:MAG TPA: SusD/RagB family nutrient-binding outer membrane lipoprotein [Mucilaginibacter sp.]|jgi:hypothetical protein|nr:SusD/RagB family nutrient-binding outer membrane lipoprotein [Mucilaginibacter sp.]